MVEDVEGVLGVRVQLEVLARPLVGDCDLEPVVLRPPQEGDGNSISGSVANSV
jgi:hypothetical protein